MLSDEELSRLKNQECNEFSEEDIDELFNCIEYQAARIRKLEATSEKAIDRLKYHHSQLSHAFSLVEQTCATCQFLNSIDKKDLRPDFIRGIGIGRGRK